MKAILARSAIRPCFRSLTVPIKLWDVVGVAARRND